MSWRRFLLLAALLVLATSVLTAVVPRGEDRGSGSTAEPLPATQPAPVVHGTLPGDKEVRARLGDVVALTVSAPAADVVEVPTLGVEQPVDSGVPAQLVFVADRPGRFRVILREAAEPIGTLQIDG